MTPEHWEATASSVRDGSSGGLPPADATSEELFLAPQTVVAEVVPLISPVQSLPMVKPCPYVDVRLKDAADKALHVGPMVAYPPGVFGSLRYTGSGSLSSAVGGEDPDGGGLPSAIGSAF